MFYGYFSHNEIIVPFHTREGALDCKLPIKFSEVKPEAHGPQRSPECTAMKATFSQNTVNVACKKN